MKKNKLEILKNKIIENISWNESQSQSKNNSESLRGFHEGRKIEGQIILSWIVELNDAVEKKGDGDQE